jgi:hypothetical protein
MKDRSDIPPELMREAGYTKLLVETYDSPTFEKARNFLLRPGFCSDEMDRPLSSRRLGDDCLVYPTFEIKSFQNDR